MWNVFAKMLPAIEGSYILLKWEKNKHVNTMSRMMLINNLCARIASIGHAGAQRCN